MTEVEDWGSTPNPEPGQSWQVIPIRHATARPYVLNRINSPRASSSWTALRKLNTDAVTGVGLRLARQRERRARTASSKGFPCSSADLDLRRPMFGRLRAPPS